MFGWVMRLGYRRDEVRGKRWGVSLPPLTVCYYERRIEE
jgi:hypothetical protein